MIETRKDNAMNEANGKIVMIKDLVGTAPIQIDQRTRNADGTLKYPEQQKTPRYTTLRRVYIKKVDGKPWLYWEWDKIVETPFCQYSGLAVGSNHETDYALMVFEAAQ